jgi:nitroimidazol reductase NimA-like FMN-containing flavoprotein (pyridoxamine 5'-phosphate oxidase superfamily)
MDETTNELTPQECWTLLGTSDLGRLAVCLGEVAEIFPVNYAVAHGTVVFRTAPGLKHVSARLNGLLTFEADGVDRDAGVAWSVVVKGRGHDMADGPEAELARTLNLRPAHGGPKPLFVRIEPDVVTGRRFRIAPAERWVDEDGRATDE